MNEVEQTKARPEIALAVSLMAIAALYFAREILIPIAVAGFLAVLLWPLVRFAERTRLGRVFAVVAVTGVTVLLLTGVGWLVTKQAARVVESLPRHRDQLIDKIRHWRESVPGTFSRATETVKAIRREITTPVSQPTSAPATEPVDENTAPTSNVAGIFGASAPAPPEGDSVQSKPMRVEVVPPAQDFTLALGNMISPLLNPLLTIGITIIFTLFFLLHQNDLRDRVIRLCGEAHINVTTTALSDAGARITRYVAAQALVNTMFGVAIGIGLLVIGMPDALLWGLLSAALRFVPYVGTAIAALAPTLISVATSDSAMQPLAVAGWFIAVDLLVANFFEPSFFGSRVGASPTAILLGFVFWGWLWGGIGVFLATPITVCLVVLGKHVPAFEKFYIVLGNEPALEPSTRFYQRLLALDATEALAIVRKHSAETAPATTYDEIVLPALAQLEDDRHGGIIEPARIEHTRKVLEQLLAEVGAKSEKDGAGEAPDETGAEADAPVPARTDEILCILDKGEYDRSVVQMVEQILIGSCPILEVVSASALTSEIVDLVRVRRPRAVLIAAIAPRNTGRVQLICQRLAEAAPQVPLLVGLIARPGQQSRRLDRIRRMSNVRLFRSLADLSGGLRDIAPAI